MKNQTDFSSRIGVRAVVAGIMASLSIMILSFSLIAALGFWNFNLNDITTSGTSFWVATTIAWSISLYFAGFIAALGAKSQTTTEGVLNAFAACCGSYLIMGILFLVFAPAILDSLLTSSNPQYFLRSFLGDTLAFVIGIFGGVTGTHFEQRALSGLREHGKNFHYSS